MMRAKMSKTPVIIVPTRLGSTRFPRKLLFPVRGKPVILWTAERIRAVAPEFPLYFAVDDAALEACLEQAGYKTVMTRPDHPSGTDRLAEANAVIGADAVINVQGDEPLVTGEQIRTLAAGLADGAAMSTLAVPFERPEDFANPNQVKVVRERSGLALYFSRSPIPLRGTSVVRSTRTGSQPIGSTATSVFTPIKRTFSLRSLVSSRASLRARRS